MWLECVKREDEPVTSASAAVVLGATGGIGVALADTLEARREHEVVHRIGRSNDGFDLADPDSIRAAAERVASGPPPDLVLLATGLLSEGGHGPERALGDLDPDWLARQFAVNVIGPALVMKAFLPLLPRDRRAVFGVLSAKVGSISDNRLGGWYGYRASKAALNQLVRTASVELARTHPRALCVALHPGTVATKLSAPFTGRREPDELFTPADSAARLLAVLGGLTPADSGRLWSWDGREIAP